MQKLIVLAALAALMAPVQAQEVSVPSVTTASPGYLFPNDQYQRGSEQQSSQANAASQTPIEFDAEARRRIEAAIKALVPEYQRRFERDGEQAANDWIRIKSFELGQQEADIMKQRLGR